MRVIIVTGQSVYVGKKYPGDSTFIEGRVSFDSPLMPTDRIYSGPVIGAEPRIGERFRFNDPDLGPVNVSQVQHIYQLED